MGVYGLDGRSVHGVPFYVQTKGFSNPRPDDPFYLYRAGDQGRWIIVKGTHSMEQQQCVRLPKVNFLRSAPKTLK